MKPNRVKIVVAYMTVVLSISAAFKEKEEEDPKEKLSLIPGFHQSRPSIFGIFSKPPQPDAPEQDGMSLLGHVLQGGPIGFQLEVRPLAPLQGIIGHFKKKLIPNREKVGRPAHEVPEEPPKNEHWEEEWEMKKPEKPNEEEDDEGPHWEDIGEEPESTEVPIEDIIQPRLKPKSRPKRFIESKVYHVPLLFRSNGKPYQVVDKSENALGSKERI